MLRITTKKTPAANCQSQSCCSCPGSPDVQIQPRRHHRLNSKSWPLLKKEVPFPGLARARSPESACATA